MASLKPAQEAFIMFKENIKSELSACFAKLVPSSRTINKKPLSDDINLTAADVGTYTSEQIDEIKDELDSLLNNLDNREPVEDLLAEANKGVNCRRIVVCKGDTINTPYRDDKGNTSVFTNKVSGLAIIFATSADHAVIFYIVNGSGQLFVNAKDTTSEGNGVMTTRWSGWRDITGMGDSGTSNSVQQRITELEERIKNLEDNQVKFEWDSTNQRLNIIDSQ